MGEDAVYNFIRSLIKESKYCGDAMKKHFNKELAMTKEYIENMRTQLNFGSLIMTILMVMLK